MECIIIAIPKREFSEKIADVIRRRGIEADIRLCSSAAGVLDKARDQSSGILICTEKIRDMGYSELFDYLPGEFEMILLSKSASAELWNERMTLLKMPFQASELANLVTERLGRLQKLRRARKKVHFQRTPEEQQIIDRAKELLMKKYSISEPEAFRSIQKQSMDVGRSMVESAQMILLLNSEW